jgi:hypothetical protein
MGYKQTDRQTDREGEREEIKVFKKYFFGTRKKS